MSLLDVALTKILGRKPRFLRPPFGDWNDGVLAVLGAANISHVAMWDADSGDAGGATLAQEQAVYNGLNIVDGHVTLNHDTVKATAQALVPWVITWAQARRLKMVTMGECAGLPPAAWYYDVVKPESRNPSWKCGR